MNDGDLKTKATNELNGIMTDYSQFKFLKAAELNNDNISKALKNAPIIEDQEATPDVTADGQADT
jgi:hypothetical protein